MIKLKISIVVLILLAFFTSCTEGEKKTQAKKETKHKKVEIATYKNTTEIPVGITTPDIVETSIGTLNFFDGVPTKETADNVHAFVDKARGVDVFLKGIPGLSIRGLRKGPADLGVNANGKVALFDKLMDSKALFLTANTS
ncbi:MAG: hypothetical protein L3J08_08215, partial [Flavobacteriaceae bacterium]|nr:hypothetical protein [Flavobacteriaceae bacterium]